MTLPLMPKATAVWLIENTTLTFDQIAEFCGMHHLEVQGIADGDVAPGVIGVNPVASGQISPEMLDRAQKDPKVRIELKKDFENYVSSQKKKKSRYTPVARRQDKPDAIAWFLKNHPELSDAQVAKLVGTTKTTISSIRERAHWNISNIRPRDPVLLGLCTQTDLQAALDKAVALKERQEKEALKKNEREAKAKAKKAAEKAKKKAAAKPVKKDTPVRKKKPENNTADKKLKASA